jgi:hypothetical protein
VQTEQEKVSSDEEILLNSNTLEEQRALDTRVKIFKTITYELNDLEEYLKTKFRFFDFEKAEERISDRFTRK